MNQKPCVVCGKMFTPSRPNNTICPEPRCKAAKRRERQSRYSQTEKGKAVTVRYRQSEKWRATSEHYGQSKEGKEKVRRWKHSDKRKVAERRYLQSEKGKIRQQRYDQSEKGKMKDRRQKSKARAAVALQNLTAAINTTLEKLNEARAR